MTKIYRVAKFDQYGRPVSVSLPWVPGVTGPERRTSNDEIILAVVRQNQPCTKHSVAKAMGVQAETAGHHLRRMARLGQIVFRRREQQGLTGNRYYIDEFCLPKGDQ